MDLKLKNQVVIVTGGGRGIGAGIVRTLAAEGAIPVIVGRDRADHEAVLRPHPFDSRPALVGQEPVGEGAVAGDDQDRQVGLLRTHVRQSTLTVSSN